MKRKGLTFLKRLLSLCLVFCLAVSFFACTDGMSPVENALIAVKGMDMAAFSSYMTSDSDMMLSRITDALETGADDEERETLKSLYGLIRYTMGEESAEKNGEKTIAVTVKIPDMARIRTLAEKKILVSAETANAVISEMLVSGEIESYYMLDAVWQITVREEDGKWLIPYNDKVNADFVSGLYLAEMTAFFAKN